MKKYLIALSILLILAACSSEPTPTTAPTETDTHQETPKTSIAELAVTNASSETTHRLTHRQSMNG